MLKALQNAFNTYISSPLPYLYALFLRLFLILLTLLSSIAVVMFLVFLVGFFNLVDIGSYVVSLSVLFAVIFFFYFWSVYKGAMIKSFITHQSSIRNFLNYGLSRSRTFFAIFLVRNSLVLLLLLPSLLSIYYLNIDPLSPLGIIILLIGLFLFFMGKFFSSFSYIISVVDEVGVIESIKRAVKFVLKNNLRALLAYLFYLFAWFTLLIPIFNLFTLLLLYPVIYIFLINFYKGELTTGPITKSGARYSFRRRRRRKK